MFLMFIDLIDDGLIVMALVALDFTDSDPLDELFVFGSQATFAFVSTNRFALETTGWAIAPPHPVNEIDRDIRQRKKLESSRFRHRIVTGTHLTTD